MVYQWDTIQRLPDGRILLLYRHQRLFDEGVIQPNMDVLDIGGWGVLAQAVIESGSRCTILDLFTEDQYYPDRVRLLPHKTGDARDQSHFEDASFDVVTCFEMLEHCGDAGRVLKNAHAWLRPGGMIAGTVPIPGFCHDADQPGIVFLSETALADRLQDACFSIERIEPTGSVSTSEEPSSIYFSGRKAI